MFLDKSADPGRSYMPVAAVFCVTIVTFAAFLPCLGAGFVMWDDDRSIYQNELIETLDFGHVRDMFAGHPGLLDKYAPLYWLSLALTRFFFGLNPFFFHLSNLALHCASAVLLFFILRLLLQAALAPDDKAACAAAFAATLFWSINPLRVEVVALAANRSYCQAVFFLLASFWLYAGAPAPERKGLWLLWSWRTWASVLLFSASLLSFPAGLGFGASYLAHDAYFRKRLGLKATDILLRVFPFAVATGLVLAANLAVRQTGPTASSLSLDFEHVVRALYMVAYYAWKPWVPWGLSPVNTILLRSNPADWHMMAGAAAALVLTLTLLLYRARHPGLLFLWALHLAFLVPFLGLTEKIHYPADRYALVQGTVTALAVGAGLCLACQKAPARVAGALRPLALVLMGALALGSFAYTWAFNDSLTLFDHILKKLDHDPYAADIYWRIGKVYQDQGQTGQALRYYDRSVEMFPDCPPALLERGMIFLSRQDDASAAKDLEKAAACFSDDTRLHLALADIAMRRYDFDAAWRHLNVLLSQGVQNDTVYAYMAMICETRGDMDQALAACKRALEINPWNRKARRCLDRISLIRVWGRGAP